MADPTSVRDSVAVLDALLLEHPQLSVRIAWRQVRGVARRVKRISEVTLPRISAIAQHAVYVREAIDVIIPALPPTLYQTAVVARTHILAILSAVSTGTPQPGAPGDSYPPPARSDDEE